MKCLVAVVGPTAVGKSQLALHLAREFDGEIINADSRQVYRYMDIGTAKPSRTDLALVRHHLIDIINPDKAFSLAIYQRLAVKAIENIQQRHKLPLLVGGSGLYIWSTIEGWKIPPVAPDIELRLNLESRAKSEGIYALYQELQKTDPEAATKIMPTNLRRIIRALEISRATGQPLAQLRQKQPPSYPVLIIGLTSQREDLYRKIDSRVDEMIKNGLIDEVKNLMAMGYSPDLHSMSGMGYKQIAMFLQQKLDLPECVRQIKHETHRFARHQYSWFHLDDSRIHWFDEYDNIHKESTDLVSAFLNGISKDRQVSHELC